MNKQLGDFIYYSKYAKTKPNGQKETYEETIDRVTAMHIEHINKNYPQAFDNAEFSKALLTVQEMMKEKKVYGSQRALQFGGDKILTKNARLYNCAFSYCDRPEFFGELLWVLLCGCGAGQSVHTHHVSKLPTIHNRYDVPETFVIQDNIEGWADGIKALTSSFFTKGGNQVVFDYSKIRPKGSPISGGFIAPGPDGLREAIENIEKIFENRLKVENKLRPIDCFSISCHLASAVLSGGVRRSALSTLFDPNDEEMRDAKIGDWFNVNPHFARSNNSATFVRSEVTYDEFSSNFDSARQFGEPGFAFVNNVYCGYNPCFEISMEPRTEEGETGWMFCNLTTISGINIKTEQEFYDACIASAILGTIQASYTDFSYLGEITEKLVKRDSLLGCSISGLMSNPKLFKNKHILQKGAEYVREYNRNIAEILGINPAARTTCVKPKN